jgi:TRAP-type C4-dicarboxylate transport system substrate-binding protein
MPWGEVVPALASGVLNAVSTSSTSAVDGRFWEFIRNYNQIRWQMNSQMVTVNLSVWNKLKPEQQKAIEDIAKSMEEQFRQSSITEDDKNIAVLQKNGMKTNIPTEKLKDELAKVGESFWRNYAKSVGSRANEVLAKYLGRSLQ